MSVSSLNNFKYSLELQNTRKKRSLILLNSAVIANILLISISLYWLALINLSLLILFWASARKTIVLVDAEGIRYPSFPPSFFKWDSLSHVILKDGLLTIDKKDNKLIQQQLANASHIQEDEFNAYCRSQLQQV